MDPITRVWRRYFLLFFRTTQQKNHEKTWNNQYCTSVIQWYASGNIA
jgi:hypothetical protein